MSKPTYRLNQDVTVLARDYEPARPGRIEYICGASGQVRVRLKNGKGALWLWPHEIEAA